MNLQSNDDLGVGEGGVWEKVKRFIPACVPPPAAAALAGGGGLLV